MPVNGGENCNGPSPEIINCPPCVGGGGLSSSPKSSLSVPYSGVHVVNCSSLCKGATGCPPFIGGGGPSSTPSSSLSSGTIAAIGVGSVFLLLIVVMVGGVTVVKYKDGLHSRVRPCQFASHSKEQVSQVALFTNDSGPSKDERGTSASDDLFGVSFSEESDSC